MHSAGRGYEPLLTLPMYEINSAGRPVRGDLPADGSAPMPSHTFSDLTGTLIGANAYRTELRLSPLLVRIALSRPPSESSADFRIHTNSILNPPYLAATALDTAANQVATAAVTTAVLHDSTVFAAGGYHYTGASDQFGHPLVDRVDYLGFRLFSTYLDVNPWSPNSLVTAFFDGGIPDHTLSTDNGLSTFMHTGQICLYSPALV
jgi:hypothetical protein